MSDSAPSALQLHWSENGRTLVARFDPLGLPCLLDRDSLLAAISAAGAADLAPHEEAIERFAGLAARAEQPFFLDIAERRDGICQIAVSEDAMTAWLTLLPARGGNPIDRADVARALAERGVVSGLIESAITEALADGHVERRVIARGRPAEAGAPARFVSLVPAVSRRGPRVNERGVANYRELSALLVVKPGDALMRRTPPTPGVSGEDVFGLVIPATAGADVGFSTDASGTAGAEADPDLLCAAIAGQPVLLPTGVRVDPTLHLATVDLALGNVDFDGTVNVAGDVAAGMRIRVSGDVFVGGTVEAAAIEAGGNIVIGGGAIGHAERRAATDPAQLRAGGSVSVQFCENAVIESGSDVLISEVAIHCDITALQQVMIGKPGGRKSQLIGGQMRASELVRVGVIGSSGGVRTQVQVGVHPHIHAELAQAQKKREANLAKLEDLHKLMALPDEPGRDRSAIREKALRTVEAVSAEQATLDQFITELTETLVVIENARVEIGEAVHPGVEVQIGSKLWRCTDALPAGVLVIRGDAVTHLRK